jgi:exonuclease SbcC
LDSRDRERIRAEENLGNAKRNLQQAERTLNELLERSSRLAKESVAVENDVKVTTQRLAELDEKLKPFASLGQELQQAQQTKEQYAKEHQVFIQNQPLASRVETFQAALKLSRETEARTAEQVRQRTEQLEQASRDFDAEKLRAAQQAAADAKSELLAQERELENALGTLKKEKERLNQWKEACGERDRIENEASRQRAAAQLAKVAAKVLKDAAPKVADRLCSRIAANAQRIFNQINHEPIELEWKAEPHYSLLIVPGHRRFAMLSGGEQTKLALAMTLAMIQEFSGLHFAVFDEPTYAVDSESRQKLADAILEAQKAAGLEQLIVVSHDDAFEGKIENVVMLKKTAAGTELVAG